MRAEKAGSVGSFPVKAMARVLDVTPQGYYAFVKHPPSARVRAEAELCEQVWQIFDESDATYGSPRVHRELRDRGFRTSKRRVERALRGMGLTPPRPRRHCKTTMRDLSHPVAPNLLARDFEVQRPNERWVTDITYVWTESGWVYLAAILDLFSRAVVGWSVDTTLSTRLPLAALEAAIRKRRPDAGLLHHSDRGCSTRATSTGQRRTWRDVHDVRQAAFEYIEVFYNRRRLHSSLGYKPPALVEK